MGSQKEYAVKAAMIYERLEKEATVATTAKPKPAKAAGGSGESKRD